MITVNLPEIEMKAVAKGGVRYWNEYDVSDWIEQCAVACDEQGVTIEVGQVVRGIADALRRARVVP